MPYRRRRRPGTLVLKAVSSALRLQVLTLLLDRGPLSYTEIMNILKLNPSRDAGRFAYHLKLLLKTDLIEPDAKTKKYRLTDLGRMLVDVAETIEEKAFKRRRMMIRSSRLAMEEFDRNKIAESLVREANVPQEMAQKIARETEKRLLAVKAKYLTAPLIREFVNAILIEKGLEEYRHKLTRLGLPVYDITQLVRSASARSLGVAAVHAAAGSSVVEEYTLLNVLPRDIADAHLSGSLHLNNLGCWILKPNEFMHDLRFFLRNGLQPRRSDLASAASPPPKSFETALLMASNLLRVVATEVSGEQLLDYFNIFLAPYVVDEERSRIRENLRLFLLNLTQAFTSAGKPLQVSLGLETVVPNFLAELEVVGLDGKSVGSYADYAEESRLIASALLEVVLQEARRKPILQPSLIVKIRPETVRSKECEHLLFLAHQMASETGLPYFSNLGSKGQAHASYTATGCRLSDDWKKDWELDTARTGSLESVLINLPRIAYDSEGSRSKLNELLEEQLEMALRALEIKYQTIKRRTRENMLPFLTQKGNGDQYFRLENSTRRVGFVGLSEAVKSLAGESLQEDSEVLKLAEEIVGCINANVGKAARRPRTRPVSAMIPSDEASKRLAELDIERYGWARVCVSGNKDQPTYTDLTPLLLKPGASLPKGLRVEEHLQQLTSGGHLAVLRLDEMERDPNELLYVTKQLVATSKIGFFTFGRNLAYCAGCQRNYIGKPSKCPSCGSVHSLISYSQPSAKYAPASLHV